MTDWFAGQKLIGGSRSRPTALARRSHATSGTERTVDEATKASEGSRGDRLRD